LKAHRYNAACAVALAGCGQGADARQVPDKEQAHWRRQALTWLRAELARWAEHLDARPQERATVQKELAHLRQDADFAGVRDAAALSRLPEDERRAWRELWQDVEAVLTKARAGPRQ
jgi:hypothetical protein